MDRFTFLFILLLAASLLAGNSKTEATALNMMPWPSQVKMEEGRFSITPDFTVAVQGMPDDRLYAAASRALRRLSGRTGLFFKQDYVTRTPADAGASLVILCERPGKVVLGEDETYSLSVNSNKIEIRCVTDIGGLYGLETLLQLLHADAAGYYFPAVSISDAPRFPWRGLLIDACRHWMPMAMIKRNLDAMAAVKMNVLHWHLSEDQGFRVESKLFPGLHEKGSDGLYYSQQDVQDIIAYADSRGIRVVPEFDMPGHATAWFVAYPELASAKGPYKIERRYGVMDPVMDPTREGTYDFLDAFWREMTALFPDEYMHIGGDENNGKMWNANPDIQAFMKTNQIADNHALQAYFNKRLLAILTRYRKKLVGWDEILHPDMPNNIVIQSWRGTQALVESARKGYMGILSNGYYIDLCQSTAFHYLNDPVPDGSPLDDVEKKRILGGEATMWSEIATDETVDSRIWPRTAAIAERLWSPASVRDVESMLHRLEPVSLQLEEVGLTHIRNYEMMLRRLVRSANVAALKTLVDVLEPVKEYHRHDNTAYTSYSPFTRIVDACRPESMTAVRFNAAAVRFTKEKSDKSLLLSCLTSWENNQQALFTVIDANPVLHEIKPQAERLAQLTKAGMEAVDLLAKGKKAKTEWLTRQETLVQQAKAPSAETELAILAGIEALVKAAGAR
jgi:hexosaminidase